ncbi:unnamed protein product [Tilletia controversa]|uniref:Phosphatidylinositol N-acetylglucosaminyltransferase subunit H conserved domain-containing protein n=1 Tax=Tilletia controversa TaxID=13291 RepID=A0A8X7MYZ3_9BASI|nr:hypothetical protein CF328_g848 [Tilletia controversa]KAE8254982.1 hypothetical protein A4X06_0g652 [Tilletia controversa]CAD6939271.1 unnamed protein product [Tilletia controversa]CAD6981600.1 unnamed protein product [Tilletia controversa]
MDASHFPVVRSHEHEGLLLNVERFHDGSTRIELTTASSKATTATTRWSVARVAGIFGPVVALLAVVLGFGHSSLNGWIELLSQRSEQLSLFSATVSASLFLALLCVLSWPGPIVGESILVIRHLGLQHGVTRRSPVLHLVARTFGLSTDTFSHRTQSLLIGRDEIMDVVVHEAFQRWTIGSYIAVLTVRAQPEKSDTASVCADDGQTATDFALQPGGQGGVVVLFPHLRPRLKLVQIAYTEIHRTLF